MTKEAFIKQKIDGMSLDEKVGHMLTFTWRGCLITPSGIEQIVRLHAGGLCLEPYTQETCKNLYWGNSQLDPDFVKPPGYFAIANTYFNNHNPGISVTPEEYTEILNQLQKIAVTERPSGVPLHMAIDFEGDFKNDYTAGGIRQFPPPMGLAATGDLDLTYNVGLTIGRQLSAIGVTQIYSPVCDVNINPKNPEIGVRSFSDDPAVCAEFAAALTRGFQDGGLAATAKHFPGRGDSSTDAHDVLDVVRADMKRMHEVELRPFKAAIDAGVKGVMTAHTIYTAYDQEYPSTLSKRILTGLLRDELGFDGVIVSDAIGMAAILKKWPLPKACVMAIKAGVNEILLKADDESRSQCFFGIKHAVETGELPEALIDDSVRRLLGMKYDQGLFEKAGTMDPEKTRAIVRSREVIDLSLDAARRALMIVRDEENLLPLAPDQRILVVEQCIPYVFLGKDTYSHQHVFCEAMVNQSRNLILLDTDFHATDDEIEECLKLAKQADLVVMTNYYARIEKAGNNARLVKRLKDAGHTVVVVTNYPYVEGTTPEADAVVCNFSGSPDSIRVSAELLFGKIEPQASLPISNA
ncbi:MAG: glycoside hydrolase family 3 C-terminal domain-containing protein [Spirochaetales bacterium]|nr:glycoside hydrolase family 3 C-terminal domain-containing protein [Spirochaetales bacterium]